MVSAFIDSVEERKSTSGRRKKKDAEDRRDQFTAGGGPLPRKDNADVLGDSLSGERTSSLWMLYQTMTMKN